MRYIIAGRKQIFEDFCRTHGLNPKEAVWLYDEHSAHGITRNQEIILTCLNEDFWQVKSYLRLRGNPFIRIPCSIPPCVGNWDRETLDAPPAP